MQIPDTKSEKHERSRVVAKKKCYIVEEEEYEEKLNQKGYQDKVERSG